MAASSIDLREATRIWELETGVPYSYDESSQYALANPEHPLPMRFNIARRPIYPNAPIECGCDTDIGTGWLGRCPPIRVIAGEGYISLDRADFEAALAHIHAPEVQDRLKCLTDDFCARCPPADSPEFEGWVADLGLDSDDSGRRSPTSTRLLTWEISRRLTELRRLAAKLTSSVELDPLTWREH